MNIQNNLANTPIAKQFRLKHLSRSIKTSAQLSFMTLALQGGSALAAQLPMATIATPESSRIQTKEVEHLAFRLHFEFAYSDISIKDIDKLSQRLIELKDKKNLRVEVVGHTDNIPVRRPRTVRLYKDNYGLSKARAQEVADVLKGRLPIADDVIFVDGKGADVPLQSNATSAGRDQNRRVEVVVVYDEDIAPDFLYRTERYSEAGPEIVTKIDADDDLKRVWLSHQPATRKPHIALAGQEQLLVKNNKFDQPLNVDLATNFPGMIASWQLEIFDSADAKKTLPIATVEGTGAPVMGQPILWDGVSSKVELNKLDGISYRLRLQDEDGREATTRFITTDLVEDELLIDADERHGLVTKLKQSTWYEELLSSNDLRDNKLDIPGGLVAVQAAELPVGGSIHLGNDIYPIGESGSIRIERQLKPGDYKMPVQVFDADGKQVIETELTTTVSDKYFFMVTLADITAGKNDISGNMELNQNDHHFKDDVFVDGRLAFYLKGKIKGKYLITGQLDTGEDDIGEIFQDLDRRDPKKLFKRIDPDRYYPVYGDGSTVTRDVDTQGKFYVRMDWDQSTALWGNYNSGFTGTELGGFNRGLYGAKIDLRSKDVTAYGDEKSMLKAFASEPDTAAARDELEGTGGSLYYLSHQDVVLGSAKLTVEVREKDSRRVRETTDLIEGRDYEIDEYQGRIILRRPLRTGVSNSLLSIIRDEPLDGDAVVLLADYEYVPTATGPDDRLTAGIRGKHWLTDNIGLGATYVQEENGNVEYDNKAVDLTLKLTKSTYVDIEYAQSDAAQNIAFNQSIDGGLNYANVGKSGPAVDGDAVSVNAKIDLAELSGDRVEGDLGVWFRDVEGGYDSLQYNNNTAADKTNFGIEGRVQVTEKIGVNSRYSVDEVGTDEVEKFGVQGDYQITDDTSVSAEYQHRAVTRQITNSDVTRDTDVIALRADHSLSERLEVFASAQVGFDDSGTNLVTANGDTLENDQYGAGFDFRVNSKMSVNGEYFNGDKGDGVRVGADYAMNEKSSAYVSYTSANQSARRRGLTLGQHSQITDKLRVYQEHRFDTTNSDQQRGNSYGVSYEFMEGWSGDFEMFAGSSEVGGTSFDRSAYSITSRYKKPNLELVNRAEVREDENATSSNDQWVLTNRISWTLDDEWSMIAKLDWSETESAANVRQARFAEADLGFAYRPIFNDKLNILGMYSYLYDLDPLQQFGSSEFDERSHVLSLEGLYDINRWFELGAKVAWKRAEIRAQRNQGDFFDNSTNLGVLRLRYHVVSAWDALLEYRRLEVTETEDSRQGMLAAVERHIGDNMKVGLGYNFTDFNDDLTALDYDAKGWFLNLVYKR